MNGIIDIEVYNKRGIKYQFSLYRKITLIRGNSGTGKTTLYRLISSYEEEGTKSGVVVNCKYPLVTLSGKNWYQQLSKISNSIVFVDEGNRFIKEKSFAKLVKNNSNYYVFFTRENLQDLPSSINEIYEIKTNKKLHTFERIYELDKNYLLDSSKNRNEFTILLTEDSKAGLQFFKSYYDKKNKKCMTSKGNSNLYKELIKLTQDKVFIFADGAALAPYVDDIYKYKKLNNNNIILCFPESFEYVLLKSGVIKGKNFKNELDKPYDFIDYKKYLTWEQYFDDLIEKVTSKAKDGSKYSKDKISAYYINEVNAKKILKVIGLE